MGSPEAAAIYATSPASWLAGGGAGKGFEVTLQQQQLHYNGREAVQQQQEQYSGGRQAVQWTLSPPSPSDWVRGIGQGQQGYNNQRQREAVLQQHQQQQQQYNHQAPRQQQYGGQWAVQSDRMEQQQQRRREEDNTLLRQGAAAGWEGSTRIASVLHLAAAAAARPKYPKAWSGDFGHLAAEPRCEDVARGGTQCVHARPAADILPIMCG